MRATNQFLRKHALVRLFGLHMAIGFTIAALFVAALLMLEPLGLGRLIATQHAWPVVILLWFFTGLTFASVQTAIAVMALDGPDEPPHGGKKLKLRGRANTALAPARVPARRHPN